MKIIYYLKNFKPSPQIFEFLKKRLQKIQKFFKKDDVLVEVELSKDKEIKGKEGLYKVKIILDLPKKSLIIAKGAGKNLLQAINLGFKKLTRQIKKS